jgi:hypothetical protein
VKISQSSDERTTAQTRKSRVASGTPDDFLWQWDEHRTHLYTNTFADFAGANPWFDYFLPDPKDDSRWQEIAICNGSRVEQPIVVGSGAAIYLSGAVSQERENVR